MRQKSVSDGLRDEREIERWVLSATMPAADHGDDPAIRLYQALGTREDVLHFDIPVGQG